MQAYRIHYNIRPYQGFWSRPRFRQASSHTSILLICHVMNADRYEKRAETRPELALDDRADIIGGRLYLVQGNHRVRTEVENSGTFPARSVLFSYVLRIGVQFLYGANMTSFLSSKCFRARYRDLPSAIAMVGLT